MKKLFSGLVVLTSLLLVACGGTKEEKVAVKDESGLKVGIVMSTGGLGDKSFNDSAYRGLEMAKKDLGIEFKYVEPSSSAEDEQFLREYAEANYNLIIATGFQMRDAAQKVAKDYPNIKFAMVDDVVNESNTRNLLFKENEGSFLMGAIAGMMSKTGTVSFVGGMQVPLIEKFGNGFEQGAKYVNPNIKVLTVYVGGQNPFNDPVRGKEAALSQIKAGSDVVYHAAGATGVGTIEAAKESGVYAIGVDSNQDDVAKGTVLTSMLKNVDIAIFDTVKSVKEGTFEAGTHQFGIKENGVGTTEFEFTKDIIGEANLKKLDEIKVKIQSGEIVVK
ncbi:MAG: BMP family lipoprotein [Fusobacteriaceae bacterium]